jgi:hypothetical protein
MYTHPPEARRFMRRALVLLLPLALIGMLGAGCQTKKTQKLEAAYGPSGSLIEVVAVLRRHIPDDTYRFPVATDFTGRNVFRSSLLRLENIEMIHADALRSGYMAPVILFSKARALERLRAFDLARDHYEEVAFTEDELAVEARRSASVCGRIAEATSIGVELENPLHQIEPIAPAAVVPGSPTLESPLTPGPARRPDQVVAEIEERVALLSFLKDEVEGTHYTAVINEEMERADEVRAAWFVDNRSWVPDGALRAASELQRVVARHGPSKRRLRHLLTLADYFERLAHEYVAASPPESLEFDPADFQELVDPTTQLFEVVAAHDGTPEKLEASRRLEAFLAFTLMVDSDRFAY